MPNATDLPRDIGEFIRDLRNNARISLRELADRAGVSNPYLSQIERGLRKPSAEVLAQIAHALRVSTPLMYLRAGLLNEKDGHGVLAAIAADPDLTIAAEAVADPDLRDVPPGERPRGCPRAGGSSHMSTTTTTNTNRMPRPVYAVAGAGDLAYRQLMKLPRMAELRAELPARVEALRAELPARVEQFRAELPARVDALRAELPGRVEQFRAELPSRVEALRTEVPAAVNTFVAGGRAGLQRTRCPWREGRRRRPYPPYRTAQDHRDRDKARQEDGQEGRPGARRPRPRRSPPPARPPGLPRRPRRNVSGGGCG